MRIAGRGRFGVLEAIQLIVSTAARVGMPIELQHTLAALHQGFPEIRMSDAFLARALTSAAERACVAVIVAADRTGRSALPEDQQRLAA